MKVLGISSLLLICSVVSAKKGGASNSASENDVLENDFGGLKSCDPSLSQIEVKWTPKEFSFNKMSTFSGYVIPNMDASNVKVCVNVTVDGIEGPLYSGCQIGACDKLKKYLPQFAKFCPFQKGKKVVVKNFQQMFNPPIQFTPATYHVMGHVYDQQTKNPIACLGGDVTIKEEDYNYGSSDYY